MFGVYAKLREVHGRASSAGSREAVGRDLGYSMAVLKDVLEERAGPSRPPRCLVIQTDASDSGAGVVVADPRKGRIHQSAWRLGAPHEQAGTSSTERELLGVLCGVVAAVTPLAGRPGGELTLVVALSDSLAAVDTINRGSGRAYGTARAMAALMAAASRRNLLIVALWLPREAGKRADVLSRVAHLAAGVFLGARRSSLSAEDLVRDEGVPPRAPAEGGDDGDDWENAGSLGSEYGGCDAH